MQNRPQSFEVVESKNFQLHPNIDRGDQLADRLMKDYGIRICSGSTYGLKNQVRIRLGTAKSNQILISALKTIGYDDYIINGSNC